MNEWEAADFMNSDDWPIPVEEHERGHLNQQVEVCGTGLHEVKTYDICVHCRIVWERLG